MCRLAMSACTCAFVSWSTGRADLPHRPAPKVGPQRSTHPSKRKLGADLKFKFSRTHRANNPMYTLSNISPPTREYCTPTWLSTASSASHRGRTHRDEVLPNDAVPCYDARQEDLLTGSGNRTHHGSLQQRGLACRQPNVPTGLGFRRGFSCAALAFFRSSHSGRR